MPITRQFDTQHNFILTRVSGLVNEGIIRLHLKAMNEEAARFNGLIELADCRQIEAGCRSVHDLVEAAALERGQSWAIDGRLAIVVSQPVVFGMARVYLAGNEGVRTDVHVTYSLEEAIARLQIDPKWIEALQA